MPDSSGSNLSELSSSASSLLSGIRLKAIYTDGACSGNPGPGGWGVVVQLSNGQVQELGGSAAQTTNNRMELQAAIEALKYVAAFPGLAAGGCVYTDSEYVKNGITKWLLNWKKRGWKTAQGKPVLNQDLWEVLDALNPTRLEWQYIKAHAGHPGNERADEIARAFSLKRNPHLVSFSDCGAESRRDEQGNVQRCVTVIRAPAEPKPEPNLEPNAESNSGQSVELSSLDLPGTESSGSDLLYLKQDSPEWVVSPIQKLIRTLQEVDLIASRGYWVTSSELAELIGQDIKAICARGSVWDWRNWRISKVREEEDQTLWQLERVDDAACSSDQT